MHVCQLPRIVRSFTAAQIGQPMCTENRHRSNQSTKRVRPKRIPATSNEARLRADSPIRDHVYTRYFPSGMHAKHHRAHVWRTSPSVHRAADDGAVDQAATSDIGMELSDRDDTPSTSENCCVSAGSTLAPNTTRAHSYWDRKGSPGKKFIAGGQNRRRRH